MIYRLIAPENVHKFWPVAAPWIAQAIRFEGLEEELFHIRAKAEIGQVQLWLGFDDRNELNLVLVTEGMMIGGTPTLVLRWMSGTALDQGLLDFYVLEHWAKNAGFKDLQVWGRRGWERKLKPLGFVHDYTVMRKTVDRGVH